MRAAVVLYLLMFSAVLASPQVRSVAITVDDLPYVGDVAQRTTAVSVNGKLLTAFRSRNVPVTGFVNQDRVEALDGEGIRILQDWIHDGFDLGNHTYSHPDANDLSIEQIEEQIFSGEKQIAPLMKAAGKKLESFRFPFNHTGDTRAKHDAIATFLAARGYTVATCTIDTSDYIFNAAYIKMLEKKDEAAAAKLRAEYLAYTSTEIDYYAGLNRQIFGTEPAEVMLLHDNVLNAAVIDEILKMFNARGYRFVSLKTAQQDKAYKTPDTYISKFGPMWGYRWARELNIKVDGSLEKEPSAWIVDYGKNGSGK